MRKSVIIVGAGISGLTAGFYSQLNGFKTTIFEAHKSPGGLCAAWTRDGYNFDVSMQMVMGSHSGPLNQLWRELGVSQNFRFHYYKEALHIEGMGEKLCFSADRTKTERDMMAISPEDAPLIKEYIGIIFGRDLSKSSSLKAYELQNGFDKLKAFPHLIPMLPVYLKHKSATIQDFAQKFKHPFLRMAVRFFIDLPGWPMPDFPLALMTGFMKSSVIEAGTPMGGAQKVAFYLADRFESMGGELKYNSRICDLIIENNIVKGVILEDGTERKADLVIWGADGHNLIFDVLGGRYADDKIRNMYFNWQPVRPILHVMIGVNRDFSDEPQRLVLEADKEINIAGENHKWLTVMHHCFDKTRAPEGKSAIQVWYSTNYDFWEALSKHPEEYQEEKNRIAEMTIEQLERRWPGFADQIEVVDIPTPATYYNFTGNWQSSPDGWYITTENWRDNLPLRNLPGLEGLYTIGQWTAPFTGTIIAALTGRQVIQMYCNKEGIRFRGKKNKPGLL